MTKIKYSIAILLVVFLAADMFAGGGRRNATAGATELLIPVGAQGIAMGSAALTHLTGASAIYWNPANVARSNRTDVMFSHMQYIGDIGVTYGAVASNIEGFGTVGFDIKTLSIGDIQKTTNDNPDGTGQYFTPQIVTLGATYSRMLSDRVSVGFTANLISEKIDFVSVNGISFNLGVSYNNLANIDGLSMAIVMKHIGPEMKFEGSGLFVTAGSSELKRPEQLYALEAAAFELPSSLEIAFGYVREFDSENSISLAGLFQNNNFNSDMYKVGAEYSYNDMFFVRGGYSFAPQLEAEDNIYGVTLGAGLKYDMGGADIQFDYAYRAVDFFDANNVFTVTLGF